MPAGFPAANSTYVPSFEASGKLIEAYSRNPKSFAVNRWAKIVPVKKGVGYYLKITAEEAARIINSNLSDFVWHDGQEAPMGNDNLESFQFAKYGTTRYAYPFNLGDKTVEQADWDILAIFGGFSAQRAMTARVQGAATQLTDTALWGSSYDTATNLGGGKWDVSGATDKFILKTFNQVAENILKNTLGAVTRKDIRCVINPNVARQMAESEEIRDFVKQQANVMDWLTGQDPKFDGDWGLPKKLYGIEIVVDDTVKVTTKKGAATTTRSYVFPAATAVFMSRPGGVMGMEGVPEFSTFQYFMLEEMVTEHLRDVNNRRTIARIVDDWDAVLVAPASGWLATSVVD